MNPWFQINPIDFLKSGQITTADIGKTIYLSNSICSCQEWIIADVNHNGEVGVDLTNKYAIFISKGVAWNGAHYRDSSLRSFVNNELYNGFSNDVKNALQNQTVLMQDGNLSDKIMLPSANEIGINKYSEEGKVYNITVEGSIYPIFGSSQQTINASAVLTYKPTGAQYDYPVRSRTYSPDTGRLSVCSAYGYLGEVASGDSWLSKIQMLRVFIKI